MTAKGYWEEKAREDARKDASTSSQGSPPKPSDSAINDTF